MDTSGLPISDSVGKIASHLLFAAAQLIFLPKCYKKKASVYLQTSTVLAVYCMRW